MTRLTPNERAKPPGSKHITREDAWQVVLRLKPALDRLAKGMAFGLTRGSNKNTTAFFRISVDEANENAQGAAYEGALRAVEAKAPNLEHVEGYMMNSARNAIWRAFEDLLVQMGGDGSHGPHRTDGVSLSSFDGLFNFSDPEGPIEESMKPEVQEKILVPGFDDSADARIDYERGDTPTQRALRGILTPTQWEVLQMAADGLTINEIAQLREISRSTVQSHLEDARRRAREALA